jgi:hypothetical protein
MVAATQNPVEFEGTYPLPEAQLDRFLMKIRIDLPERDAEIEVLNRHARGFDPHDLDAAGLVAVAGPGDLEQARREARAVVIHPQVLAYIVDVVRARVLRKSAAELLPAFVNAMAEIEPVLVETNHRVLVTEILQRVSQRSLVVILAGLEDAVITEGLIPVLAPVRRRHKIVLAAVSDPRTDQLVAGRDGVGEVYAAAAAATEAARRGATVQALRTLGGSVVQAPPDSFAPALADHYLALKKAGQL